MESRFSISASPRLMREIPLDARTSVFVSVTEPFSPTTRIHSENARKTTLLPTRKPRESGVFLLVAANFRGRRARYGPTVKRLLVSAFLPVLFVACSSETAAPVPAAAPDVPVFVISIDTLRSDRVGAYGYAEETTPAIDAFRKDAVLFESAWSPIPLTLPSHATLFTGLYPYAHGVRDNLGYRIPEDPASLPAVLSSRGYETGAAVSSYVLRADTGMSRGFGTYDDFMTYTAHEAINSWQRPGDVSREMLVQWLSGTRAKKVFGFLHLYEPHSPYTPPEPFASRFEDPYDGEVAAADAVVGAFLDDLRAKGLYDDAIIVILSDHGEGLGDHGESGHGVFLYRESIQIPLLVKFPRGERAGESVAAPVSIADVMPTVLARLGAPVPTGIHGIDLSGTSAVPDGRRVYSESYYPRIQYGWHELVSLVDGKHHYIDAPKVELYDLVADPAEKTNLADANRRLVAERRDEVRTIQSRHPFRLPSVADPEDVAKLAALGYLGGGSGEGGGDLPDAKDMLGLLEMLQTGASALQSGRADMAEAVAKRIVRDHPDFLHGWGLLSSAYQKQGKLDLALGSLKEQMKRAPSNAHIALWIASIQLSRGELDDARRHAELALSTSPQLAREMLADVALAGNDLAEAERQAEEARKIGPERIQPLLVLAQVRERQGQFDEALTMLDRAAGIVERQRLAPIAELQFRRGQALLQLRRVGEAETAFRAEVGSFPGSAKAWANLALVVAGQGRAGEAQRVLDEALVKNPTAEMRRLSGEARRIIAGAGR